MLWSLAQKRTISVIWKSEYVKCWAQCIKRNWLYFFWFIGFGNVLLFYVFIRFDLRSRPNFDESSFDQNKQFLRIFFTRICWYNNIKFISFFHYSFLISFHCRLDSMYAFGLISCTPWGMKFVKMPISWQLSLKFPFYINLI